MKPIKVIFCQNFDFIFLFLLLAQSILLNSCSNNKISLIYKNRSQEQGYKTVNFNDLLNKPKNYANQKVEVTGFYKSSVEVSALYSNRRRLNNEEISKALWIRFDIGFHLFKNNTNLDLVKSYSEFEKIDGKKIKVRGTFFPDSKGHLSRYFGTLGKVVYLEVLN